MATKNGNSSDDHKPMCGIIMPISEIDNCSAEHWSEVLSILQDVIIAADFDPNLVSDADDIGIIQKRIVQNVYSNEVVVCDVSGKNPNVMFELGMRLAFDKPTIIIKDDHTDYSFDTSVIEHLEYPRDLRFSKIITFKEKLKNKITATYQKSKADPTYSTFLKSFGEYKIAHLQNKEVSSEAYILESLEEMKAELRRLRRSGPGLEFSRKPAATDECMYTHISEYVHDNGISKLSELRKQRAQLLNYLKTIDHIEFEYGRNWSVYLDSVLANSSLLKKLPQVDGSSESKKIVETDNN